MDFAGEICGGRFLCSHRILRGDASRNQPREGQGSIRIDALGFRLRRVKNYGHAPRIAGGNRAVEETEDDLRLRSGLKGDVDPF